MRRRTCFSQFSMSCRVNFQANGFGVWLVNSSYNARSHADRFQLGKIVWRQHLSLDDRKIDLHLVQPTRMDRRVYQYDSLVTPTHTLHRHLASMRRAVVHDEEQLCCILVGILLQHLIHQQTKRLDPRLLLASSHDDSTMHVPRRQILQRAVPLVFRFDPPSLFRSGRCFLMPTPSSLDTRLFIHAEHIICPPQRLAFPHACVQVENRPSLLGKLRVLRKKPMFMLPRFDRRLVQHPPHSTAADLLLSVVWARRMRSASDCRLRGSSVSAIISHAIAWINA